MKKRLTEKQQNFITRYIQNGFNAYQAARDAGYSHKFAESQAYSLVDHPLIKERLNIAYQSAEHNLNVTYEWKVNVLKRIITAFTNECNSAKNAKVAIMAISELNKMEGHHSPKKQFSVSINATKERLLEAKRVYEEY